MEGKKRTRRGGGDRANQAPKMRKSCDSCALAKRKCDGKSSCSLCLKRASPCVYSERQKSGPKGVKTDEDGAEIAETAVATTTKSATATTTGASNTTTTTTTDTTVRKSPAKRVRVPSPSSKSLGPKQKKQSVQQQKPATAVGWLSTTSSVSKGKLNLGPRAAGTSAARSGTGSGSGGGGDAVNSASVKVEAGVSVKAAATLPPTSKPSPKASSTSPPRVKPKTAAGKEPRPQHQRLTQKLNRKQQDRQRAASAPKLPAAAAASAAAAATAAPPARAHACSVSPTAAATLPRRRPPQFNSTAAAKIAALPPMIPSGENMRISSSASSRHPVFGGGGGGGSSRGGGGGGLSLPLPLRSMMLPGPPLSDSTSSADGSSGWDSGIFVASPEDEVLWNCDEFDGRGGGSRDDHPLGGGGGGVFSELPPLAVAVSGGRSSGIAGAATARRDMGKGLLPTAAHHQRPCSPIMVFSGRSAVGGGGGGRDLKPTAYGGGRGGHDGFSGAARMAAALEGRGFGSPISSWTQEETEANVSTLFTVLTDPDFVLPSGGGVAGVGGGGWGGTGGGSHPQEKRPFMSWPPQQTHSLHHEGGGVAASASFANTGGYLPPLPSLPSVDSSRLWHHGQQRGGGGAAAVSSSSCDTRNLPEVTMPLDGNSWAWGTPQKRHLAAF